MEGIYTADMYQPVIEICWKFRRIRYHPWGSNRLSDFGCWPHPIVSPNSPAMEKLFPLGRTCNCHAHTIPFIVMRAVYKSL